MDEKQGPPSYNEASGAPPAPGYNPGYVPPAGDQGGNPGAYPPPMNYGTGYATQVGYTPQPAGNYNYGQQQQQQQQQSTVVVAQPMAGAGGMYVNNVPDHMGLAIFTTICCCWPLGLVAIMRAQESRRALDRGDIASASSYSAEARRYSLWAIAGGCISIVLVIVIVVVVVTQNTYYYSSSTYG